FENCLGSASASTARDRSSGKFRPHRTADTIRGFGSQSRSSKPSASENSRSIGRFEEHDLAGVVFGGRSGKDKRRSASNQMVSGPLTVKIRVTKPTPTI